jgi:hypothetical protein
MKKLPVFLLLAFVCAAAFGQTRIHDGKKVSGTWKAKKSPYIIEGEAIVPEGKTLKIKPGVVVKFNTGEERDYSFGENPDFDLGFLRVNGTLIASGTSDNRISFTRNGAEGFWGVVFFDSRSEKNKLSHCDFSFGYHIRHAVQDDNGTGVVSFFKSNGIVEHCVFVDNGWTAINCKEGSSPEIRNNTLIFNQYGIECNTNSAPSIVNTILYGNDTEFYVNGGSAPTLSWSLTEFPISEEGLEDSGHNMSGTYPEFRDEDKNDFRLSTGSPCIGAGKGGKNIGAF